MATSLFEVRDLHATAGDTRILDGVDLTVMPGVSVSNEILQLAILDPVMAILDETDSVLDVDALHTVARGIQEVRSDRPHLGVLAITHHQRLLNELAPDMVHIFLDGRVVASGGVESATELESEGYGLWRHEVSQ